MDDNGTDNSNPGLAITLDTKVSDVLNEYGDIADVMETFGIKRVGGYSLRRYITKVLTVERAAKIHRVDPEEFLCTLQAAVGQTPTPPDNSTEPGTDQGVGRIDERGM